MSQSDFLKSPTSVKSEDIDNISQHSDDDDDMDCSMLERPHSPQVPLSLTTHERHRLSSSDTEHPNAHPSHHSLHQQHQQQQLQEQQQQLHSQQHPIIKTERHRSRSPNALSTTHNGTDDHSHRRSIDLPATAAAAAIVNHQHNEDTTNDCHTAVGNHNNDDGVAGCSSSSMKDSPQSDDEDLDMESDFRSPASDAAKRAAAAMSFPIVPNSMFSHSIMYMSHYIPQMGSGQAGGSGGTPGGGSGGGGGSGQSQHGSSNASLSPQSMNHSGHLSNDERRKRNRTFIDPVTEVPKLEQWFAMNTHPSHNLILKYTEDLNRMPYR